MLRQLALAWAKRTMAHRPHDFAIGPAGNPYMLRWYITPWSRYDRSKPAPAWSRLLPNIYLHHILHDDEDRALHDHPWPSVSWLLENPYYEFVFAAQGLSMDVEAHLRPEGAVVVRGADVAHRLVLTPGYLGRGKPVISLFFTGWVVRGWGFWCSLERWVPWRQFVAVDDRGSVGKGCD